MMRSQNLRGISQTPSGKWSAGIGINCRRKHTGTSTTKEQAAAACGSAAYCPLHAARRAGRAHISRGDRIIGGQNRAAVPGRASRSLAPPFKPQVLVST
jgi:hypothetical protein